MRARTLDGAPLVPGVNVDQIDLDAGHREAERCGHSGWHHQTVVQYAMQRRARGEEDGALATMLSGGVDLTSA